MPPGYQPPPGYGQQYGYPPPGPGPAPGAPPYGQQYGAPYGQPPPGAWLPPVHKPGVVALRPLGLGDLYDGAFKTMRRNPKAMVGLGALVTTAFLVVPIVATLGLAAAGGLALNLAAEEAAPFSGGAGLLSVLYGGALFGVLANVVLNGMIVQVVAQAVVGKRCTIGEAWSTARPRLLRLVGLTLIAGLVALLGIVVPVGLGVLVAVTVNPTAGILLAIPAGLASLALFLFVQIRYFQLAAPALVLERIGVFASMRRASALSHRQFWRILGVFLLTGLIIGVAAQVISIPVGLLGGIGSVLVNGTAGALILVFSSYLSQVIVGTITTPFSSAVVALQYVDQRIRKEGFDVELIAAAQQGPQDMR